MDILEQLKTIRAEAINGLDHLEHIIEQGIAKEWKKDGFCNWVMFMVSPETFTFNVTKELALRFANKGIRISWRYNDNGSGANYCEAQVKNVAKFKEEALALAEKLRTVTTEEKRAIKIKA